MASTAQQANDDIIAHIKEQGGKYSDWYCGITSDIEDRLIDDHQVPKKGHWYIYRECVNVEAARSVERALIQRGCDGGTGGGDESSIYVYAYLKTSTTNP